MRTKPQTVDEYIATFPEDIRQVLNDVRAAIKNTVPDAMDAISYGIPTFQIEGKNVIHYAGYAHHIGLYAAPDGHAEFEDELSNYKRGKGSVQFPLDQPMPMDLITRIATYRAEQVRKGER